MGKRRNNYSAQLKFQVTLEAARGLKTISQIASEHGVHPNPVGQWKRQLMDEGASVFGKGTGDQRREQQVQDSELYEQIGRLKQDGVGVVEKKSCPI